MKRAIWLMPAIGLSVSGVSAHAEITEHTQSGRIIISNANESITRNVLVNAPSQPTQVLNNEELDRAINELMSNNTQSASTSKMHNISIPAPSSNGYAISNGRVTLSGQDSLAYSQPRSSIVSAISGSSAPAVAARLATRAAHGRSIGRCALYVRKALQSAGYDFTPQPSAYQYAHGTLAEAGFTKISSHDYVPQVGDVVVFNRTRKNPHGHIQIYDGNQWVSDFRQTKFSPYSQHNGYTVWRDSRYLDASSNNGTMLAFNE